MATMNVSLPDPMKLWVEDQIKGGQYANVSDYVRDLIRRDQQARQQLERLRGAIDLGLESGVSPHSLDEVFAAARKQAKA
jgi:antitoxin ParD1/3/4